MTSITYPLKIQGIYEESDFPSQNLSAFISPQASGGSPSANTFCRWGIFCWDEISSPISNGAVAGKKLHELIAEHGQDLLGNLWKPGTPFPIYMRMFENSIEPSHAHIHADATLDDYHFINNNKIWYLLHGGDQGRIAAGINALAANRRRFSAVKEDIDTEKITQVFFVEPHDVCYLPSQRVHRMIGKGIVAWEIGQFPVPALEFDNHSSPSKEAEHHLATEKINFQDQQIIRLCKETSPTSITKRIKILPYCPFFFVEEIRLIGHVFDKTYPEIFSVMTIIEGEIEIRTKNYSEIYYPGDVVLLPACLGEYDLITQTPRAIILKITPNLHGKNI